MCALKTLNPLGALEAIEAFRQMKHPRDFRPFVPSPSPHLNTPRLERTAQVMEAQQSIRDIDALWESLYREPFRGMTPDGNLRPAGRQLKPNRAPKEAMVEAARALVATLTPDVAKGVRFSLEAREWRRWHNMPLRWARCGTSLEEMNDAEKQAVLGLMRASLSPAGYSHVVDLMHINRFSGELVQRVKYLNEWSWQFGLFGEPSPTEPWGWQLFGHHIVLNCLLIGDTYVLSPTFLAAEPSIIDEGAWAPVQAFVENEEAAMAFVRGLSKPLLERATKYPSILNADLPAGRRHWADSLHLAGAFQDNRVVPNEGISGAEMTTDDRRRLMALIETFFLVMPDGPKRARLAEIEAHLDHTWFSWSGDTGEWGPFYYRIQSPVVMIEHDCHGAVFLGNEEPARFHVHTITRIPHGGDYGADLLATLGKTIP